MTVAIETYRRFNPLDVKTNAQILRTWRREARLSRQRMASRVQGLDPMTIFNAEKGMIKTTNAKLDKMLEALGKTREDLERAKSANGPMISVRDRDGETTNISDRLVKEADTVAAASGKPLVEWVTLAISSYLSQPPTETSFS